MKKSAMFLFVILVFVSGTIMANNTKMESSGDTEITRNNVSDKMANPNRIKADGLFYGRLGYGAVVGSDVGGHGVAFGFGYRYELDRFGVDFSFGNTIFNASDKDNDWGFDEGVVRLGGLWFLSPTTDITPYIGLGLSYGATVASEPSNDDYKWNWGLRGDISGGIELMRTSTIRFFIEGDLILPFYKTENGSGDENYSPSVVGSLGIGW